MNNKMKNNLKAVAYVVTGSIICVLSVIGFVLMWLSGTFLPVHVGGELVLSNRILRWALYAALVVVFILAAKLADYGMKFLIKRFRKIRRR